MQFRSLICVLQLMCCSGLFEHACMAASARPAIADDHTSANDLLAQMRASMFSGSIVHQRVAQHTIVSSNEKALVWSATFELSWKWPDAFAYRLVDYDQPLPPRFSRIVVGPGGTHLVNIDESMFFSDDDAVPAVPDIHQLMGNESWLHRILFVARVLSGELALDLDHQLLEHAAMRILDRDAVWLHTLRFKIPLGAYHSEYPGPDREWLFSIWLEEDKRRNRVSPVAFQFTIPPEVSLTPRGDRYLLASMTRTLLWHDVSIGAADDGRMTFSPPPDAKRATTIHEFLGVPEENGEMQTNPQELIDNPAPPLRLPTLQGNRVTVPDPGPESPLIVLDFWATWCAPCIRAIPQLIRLVDEYDRHDVQLYAVNVGESQKKVAEFIAKHGWSIDVLLDENEDVMAAYGAYAIPQTVLIDRTGRVRAVHRGFSKETQAELRHAIDKLLVEDAGQDAVP